MWFSHSTFGRGTSFVLDKPLAFLHWHEISMADQTIED